MTTRARVWLGAGVAGAVTVLALLIRFGAAALLSLTLALPATEAWLTPLQAEPLREEIAIVSAGRRISADLYRPPHPRAALVVVHGLSRAGRRPVSYTHLTLPTIYSV